MDIRSRYNQYVQNIKGRVYTNAVINRVRNRRTTIAKITGGYFVEIVRVLPVDYIIHEKFENNQYQQIYERLGIRVQTLQFQLTEEGLACLVNCGNAAFRYELISDVSGD